MQGLDDTPLTAGLYPMNLTEPNKIFVLSVHCNESHSYLFVSATKNISVPSKKKSEIKDYTLFLVNISKDFSINKMNKWD